MTVKCVSELHAVSLQVAFQGNDDVCYLPEFRAMTETASNPLL